MKDETPLFFFLLAMMLAMLFALLAKGVLDY